MNFSCHCLNIKFYTLDNKYPSSKDISEYTNDENSHPVFLDIGGINIEQPSLLKIKQHPKCPGYYVVNCCNCYYLNNSTTQNSVLIDNSNPIYSFYGIENKVYDEKSILNGELIPNNGIIILNKKNILNEDEISTAKLNVNYSEAYKLILNPQISKFNIGKTNLGEDYSKLFLLLQNSLSEYNDKQYKEMEKNIENYRNRLQLQYNTKKEKAGKDREILWNIICNVNKDSPLNFRQKPTFNENVFEIPNSLDTYHHKQQPYYIGSFNPSKKIDNPSFLTYHSYKMNAMKSFAGYTRSGIRQIPENSIYNVKSLKKGMKELNIKSPTKEEDEEEIIDKPKIVIENEEEISEKESQNNEEKIESVDTAEETTDTIDIESTTTDSHINMIIKKENDDKIISLKEETVKNENDDDDEIFILDGMDNSKKNEKYILDEDDYNDESLDEVSELINVEETIGMNRNRQQNNAFSIYATSVPIKIPERPNMKNNDEEEEDSFDSKRSDKDFTPPHVIIARTYKEEDGIFPTRNDATKYYSMKY